MLYFRVSANDLGQHRPPLVLIHGLFGSLENLGGIAKYLASHFTVYSLDLPNHGRSPHIANCTLEAMAQHVEQWMDEQNIRQASVLGHSLGGKVAMNLALRYPERVNQLGVLDIAPVSYPSRHGEVFAGLLAVDLSRLTSRTDADTVLTPYVPEVAVRTFLLKNLVKTGKSYTWRMNLDDLYQCYPKLISANYMGVYSGKVLFIKGAESDYIKEEYRQDILNRFPRAKLKIVPNTGHWLHAEKPELIAKIVLKAFNEAD